LSVLAESREGSVNGEPAAAPDRGGVTRYPSFHLHLPPRQVSVGVRRAGDSLMSQRETLLLGNALDALDRLFDGQSSVIDVQSIFFATGEALRNTPHHQHFEQSASQLLVIARSRESVAAKRDRALMVTDDFRHYLAQFLPVPGDAPNKRCTRPPQRLA
jgi:hypothetical protein